MLKKHLKFENKKKENFSDITLIKIDNEIKKNK